MYKVFYLNNDSWIFGKKFSAKNFGPITFIKKKYINDKGLHVHERIHYEQWKDNPILMPFRYKFSRMWRFLYEVEAYYAQLKYNPEHEELFAKFISENYNLDLTEKEIIAYFEFLRKVEDAIHE